MSDSAGSSNNNKNKQNNINNLIPSNGMHFVSSPSDFDGKDSRDAERWLIKLKQILKVNKVDDIETIMAIASSYLTDRALDWWYSIQETVTSWGEFEELFKKKFMKVIYEKAWKELKSVQQGSDEDVESISNRLRQLFRAAGVSDEGTKKAIFVASVLPGLGYEMKRFQSTRKDEITFEDLVDEATEHELLVAKYDKKRADAYSVHKKGVTFEMDNNSVVNSSINKDYISESSSISSVLSDLVNEMRALRISSVEQKEIIQQQQNVIAQHSMVLQQQQGGSTNNHYQRNSNNTSGQYQQQQRPFNEGCYNCGEYGHISRVCPYPPRRKQYQQQQWFNGSGIINGSPNQTSGSTNQVGNTEGGSNSNEAGKDMGHQ
ncbi:hypothetical protein HMPREF1544_02927 [Mucor circinelloides 1006PhL]|uniref:CCHC-type domain-containing protein n=1 Tax=Mucor circinelloides f. circinelloides (strain 1006PhL) TaxID=1220926 RepID=S2JIU3_MUCC1|nr:hypothetical protein HMPREF1544_02927 [Mucor circinelloides 1006PhL]